MPKYDVSYGEHGPSIVNHFCREWGEDGEGCYGTNEDHGMSFDRAKQLVMAWHYMEIDRIKGMSEKDFHAMGG